jgi:hypothetical protein
MMPRHLLWALAAALAACASIKPPPPDAPAPPAPDAPECVVIQAANEGGGLASEHGWLDDHYPGWRQLRQTLGRGDGDKWYDIIEFALPSGKQYSVCFEITSFFGKR